MGMADLATRMDEIFSLIGAILGPIGLFHSKKMSRDQQRIWYLLIQADGSAFHNSTADKVTLPQDADIDDLRDAVRAENTNKLANVDSPDLKVFKTKAELTGEPLKNSLAVSGLGASEEEPLFVLMPEYRVSSLPKRLKLDDLSLNLKSFVHAKLVDACIVLPEGDAFMPCLNDKIQKLFVRKCYKDVFGFLMENMASGREFFGIASTPGIGKSLFFVYVLFRFMNDSPWKPKRIVYQSGNRFECFDLGEQVVFELDYLEPAALVRDQETFYVIDGNSYPLSSSCITLFISSPRSDHFKRYQKQRGAKVWYLPVWTCEESSICRQNCYPLLPQDLLTERFRVFGGVARFGFYGHSTNPSHVWEDPKEMEFALADVNTVQCLRAVGLPSKMCATTHTLLHMIVGENQGFPYQFLYVDLASKYVGEQLWEPHHATMITNLREMLGGSPDEISRHLFEIYGHRIFSKGGKKLKCRNLDDDSESELELDTLDGQKISMDRNNLPRPPLESYYEPSDDGQFPAIDSMSNQGMFQFTVNAEHPIRDVQVLKQLCDLYNNPKLYFVVPPHRFAKFKKQNFLGEHGNAQVEAVPALEQYVLELEV